MEYFTDVQYGHENTITLNSLYFNESFTIFMLQGQIQGFQRGAQSEIYKHSYSRYVMLKGSFLEGVLNLVLSHK